MPKKKFFLVILAFTVLACAALSAEDAKIVGDTKELFKYVQLLADSIALISTEYVESVDPKELVYGGIRGMTFSLDGYSQFLEPESFKEITEETKGEFGGIGIEIGVRDNILTVIAPIEDSPAYTAGIKSGDKIVKIDGEITSDMTVFDASKKLRGAPGTKVKVTVIREGVDKMLDFDVARAVIKLKSIKDAKIIEKDIAYLKLVEFQEKTAVDLKKTIKTLAEKGAKSIIIDLRKNPGGLLDAAVETADLFLEPGQMIVYTQGRDPASRTDYKAKKKSEFTGMQMILLVDKGSASASEILAGAMKDNKRALIVGVPTFGKGSVQAVVPLRDGSAVKLTTASYFTPAGKNLRDKGVEPDILVEVPEEKEVPGAEEKPEEKTGEGEPSEKPDIQLATAVNLLKGLDVFDKYRKK